MLIKKKINKLTVGNAIELLRNNRANGHTNGCQCQSIFGQRAESLDMNERWGCRDLRRKLGGTESWAVIYEGEFSSTEEKMLGKLKSDRDIIGINTILNKKYSFAIREKK